MKLIKINNNNVELAEGTLLVPEFKEIWESNKPEKAINIFKYIYLYSDFNSPYKNYSEEDRKLILTKDLKVEYNEVVEKAISKYKDMNNTFSMRFLDAAINAANKTLQYFEQVDYEKVDVKGNPIYKIKEVTDALKNCMGVITTLESLKTKVEAEQVGNNKIRGGGNISDFEKL
jgi:hypothetical protein